MSATGPTTTTVEKPPRRFPPPCWTQDEALALIQAYRERWYALRRGYLRTADWDAVAEHVGRLSPGAVPPKTSAQCRHKMEKLRQRYRAEKQRALTFSGGRFLSTWFYFQAMDSMEKNGSGSGSAHDDVINTGNDINSSLINHQSNMNTNTNMNMNMNVNVDSVYGGLNSGRGIRFKPVAVDSNLVTVASRVRVSQNYEAQEEDNDENDNDDDEFDDVYYSGKSYPRKYSKIGSNTNSNSNVNSNINANAKYNYKQSYWNEDGENEEDDVAEDDVWVKMGKDCDEGRKRKSVGRDDDSIGQIVSSIKALADGFVKVEKMKMDMVHEIERMRMEAEMRRNKMVLESQKQIVEAFVKGLSGNKRQHQ